MRFKRLLVLAVTILLASCDNPVELPYELASFSENGVAVSLFLDVHVAEGYHLSAVFTPSDGYHLYGKDIPAGGVNGLGRPTRLDLPKNSPIKTAGELFTDAEAEAPNFEPRELLVYPTGAVTMSLPIELPPGNKWVEGAVLVVFSLS